MFVRAQIFFALALIIFLAACAGPERKVTPLAHEPPIQTAPQIEVKVEEPKVVPAPTTVPTQPVVTPAPIIVPAPVITNAPPAAVPQLPITGWVSLTDWTAQNHFPEPLIVANQAQTNVEIRAESGTFVLEPPRRNARWNGVLVGVGFPIQFTNKQAWINALDLNKVVAPLMTAGSHSRTNGGIVVIDPGHGGENGGTVSQDRKLREKDLTLDWAKRVQKLLEGSQWKAILTHDVDADMGLTQRVVFAEMKKADLFISLHFNSAPGPRGKEEAGLETYCLTPQGMASHLTRDYPDIPTASYSNNQFDAENFLLAYDLHRAILKKTGRKDRGIRRARFMTVLREQHRPAVLIEGGYLSNPDEAKLIATAAFRQKLAEAVVEALGVTRPVLTTLQK